MIDVGGEVDRIVDMLACHESQVYEWLPFNRGAADAVPKDDAARRLWLRGWFLDYLRPQANRYRQELIAAYGRPRGEQIEYAEIFEISEYAAPLGSEARRRLFPFLPA